MKKRGVGKRSSRMPKDAVLLIPEPEHEAAPYGIKAGYYSSRQLLRLLDQQKGNAEAIQFIADMLETGDPANDGFAKMLRASRSNPEAIAQIVKAASK
jgi:hypothetical protein